MARPDISFEDVQRYIAEASMTQMPALLATVLAATVAKGAFTTYGIRDFVDRKINEAENPNSELRKSVSSG